MTNLSFVLSKLRTTSSPNLCLVSCNTGRCDSAAFLKNNWQRGIKFHEQETIWETEIMPIFCGDLREGPCDTSNCFKSPLTPPPQPPLSPKALKLSLYQSQLIYRANWRDPWDVMFFPLFFIKPLLEYMIPVKMEDLELTYTSIWIVKGTSTYIYTNAQRRIQCAKYLAAKELWKKKDMNVHFKQASTSHFALQSGKIRRLRGIIYYKVSCLFTNLKINKHGLF